MINKYSVGLKALKQSQAELPSVFEVIIKIPDAIIPQQSPR